ncbi:MAG: DNA polymerase III subunit alpha [Patescibacteria group bacterium]
MNDFVHLHVHSEFSLLDGLPKLDKLAAKVKELGMDAVALTDHGAMYGSFKFFLKAKDYGIKPIIGCEVYMAEKSRFDKQKKMGADQYHLVLLAENMTGYKNLMKLVSYANLEGFHYKPRIDVELLEKYHEGIICLSGCMGSLLSQSIMNNEPEKAEHWIKTFSGIFGEGNFFIEIQRHPGIKGLPELNEELIKYSRKFGLPLVATNDSHYLDKDDAYAQEILLCIQTRTSIEEKNRPLSMYDVPDFYLKSADEMKQAFLDIPEAIENTVKIAARCNVEIPFGKWILPYYEVPEGETVETWLRKMTAEKMSLRLPAITEEIKKRIDYELDIIIKKGYAAYFLIVQDFVNWAKGHGVAVGPGRGSAAGSLVAYIISITEVNPLTHNLPFERFLNPDRPTPPDIDIDFADVRRDDVVRYVSRHYGEDKVGQIITFGSMEARMVVRDVSRALGWSYSQGDRIAKLIPQPKQGFPVTIDIALKESSELAHLYETDTDIKNMIDVSKKLEGLVRHSSVHAAGVVVADKPLSDYVPIQREERGGKIITQYDMYCLDLNAVSDGRAVGLLKFDFLGLRNLSILEKALLYVQQNRNETIELNKVSLEDESTYHLIASGETVGVFQLESRGMRHLAKELKPTRFSDISAMVALFRPGPMALIPIFVEGKKNPKKIKYLHPDLKPILSETYGILVYQEQVTEIAHKLAKFTMSEADTLRMAMGKKKKELMRKGKQKFLEGCQEMGYPLKMAEQLFEFIEKFAAYGFNKAHSASYAMIAYWTAYVKAHYPVEFMTALLTAEIEHATGADREQKVNQILEECRRMEIPVLPPDINKSVAAFSIEDTKSIRFGLGAIRNVGTAAVEAIVQSRSEKPFGSMRDFLTRVDLRKVNKKTVESMVKAGAFDAFGKRSQLVAFYTSIVKDIQSVKAKSDDGQFGLFADTGFNEQKNEATVDNLPDMAEYSEDELLEFERETIGFNLSKNPLEKYQGIFRQKRVVAIDTLTRTSGDVILGGLVKAVKKIVTKKSNQEMLFVTITDYTSEIELVVFPKTYTKTKNVWQRNQVLLVKTTIQEKDESLVGIVNDAVMLRMYDH